MKTMAAAAKERVRGMLLEKRWEEFLAWYRSERGAVRVLMSLLYDDTPLARMRAVEAMGRVGGMLEEAVGHQPSVIGKASCGSLR